MSGAAAGTEIRSPRHMSRLLKVGFAISLATAFAAFAFMLLTAIQMTASGRGTESQRTFWLVEGNWIEFLVFSGVALVALVYGAVARIREHREWQTLERKYGQPESEA